MKIKVLVTLFFCLSIFFLRSQSSNINCATALELTDVESYCSGEEEFDSEDVGESEFEAPQCWSAAQNDLWFTFIASKKSVNIIVNASNGTMGNPEIALLRGDCNFLTEVNCEVNSNTDDITSLFESNLTIGERYYIRVDGRTVGNDGTFQLCIESFTPPVVPGQDCATASVLCSKESFVVESILGSGSEPNEADGSCLDAGGSSENNSTWFKWTCAVSGTFTMDLIPLVITDDYDFAIFELVGDLESCDKNLLRCSATDGGDLEPCGPNTGLNLTSVDLEEDLNCEAGEDGYLRFIDMEAGRSYAMLINNFSDSEAGFSLSFGGTAEFAGPEADFEVNVGNCGSIIQVTDVSTTASGSITSIEWEFGSDATPQTATGTGPHTVEYSSFGTKTISLKVMSDLGCQIFETREIELQACSYIDSMELVVVDIQNINCGEAGTGRLELVPSIVCGNSSYMFNGQTVQDPIFENLDEGPVDITYMDENGCTYDTTFFIVEIADISVDAGEDVIIDLGDDVQLDAMTDATDDVTISWSPSTGVACSDGTLNCLNPIVTVTEETLFTITLTDANGCVTSDEVLVSINLCGGSTLGISIDSIRAVSCAGASTGYFSISGINGVPEYEYQIDGGDYSASNEFGDLAAGGYFVSVRDANRCEFGLLIEIAEVPDFNIDAGPDVTLNFPGEAFTPSVTTDANVPFNVTWNPSVNLQCSDGSSNCIDPVITVNETTTFEITIEDENGCLKTDEFTINVPDVCAGSDLQVSVDSLVNGYCNGVTPSFLRVSGINGFPGYEYSINGGDFGPDSIFLDLPAGMYTIDVRDRFNCTQQIEVNIEDLPPFTIDAGNDITINGTEPFSNLQGSHGAEGDVTISWTPRSGLACADSSGVDCLNPLANPPVSTTYTLTVTDENGCAVSDQVTVRVEVNENVFAPNVFSPNDDGINDVFSIQADPDIVENIESLVVFDRWGNKVYEGRNLSPADPGSGWNGLVNGVRAEQGVYVWFAEILFFNIDPENPNDLRRTVDGDVTLIR